MNAAPPLLPFRRLLGLVAAALIVIIAISGTAPRSIYALDETLAKPSLRLVISLIWEGRDLHAHNLEAIREFRREFSDIQLVHFVSPAYFTRPGAPAAKARHALQSVMRPGDKIGIALAGWKSMVQSAGVIFRSGPTFWGYDLRETDCRIDCGLDVPLNIYPQHDVEKILKSGKMVLEAQGFGAVEATTTSGWMASQQILEAYAEAGIRYDFSAVAPELVRRRIGNLPLFHWLQGLWATTTPHTQPYVVPSVVTASLQQIPQNLAAIDYLLSGDIAAITDEYLESLQRDPHRDLTLQLAFYQETAYQMQAQLGKALQIIFAAASKNQVGLRPFDVPGMDLPQKWPSAGEILPVSH